MLEQDFMKEVLFRFDKIDSKLDEHSKEFEKVNARLDEHSKELEKVNARLDEHSKEFKKVNARLDEHSKEFKKVNARLDEHSKEFKKVNARLDEHSKELEKQAKLIEQNSELIKLNAKKIANNSLEIAGLIEVVTAHNNTLIEFEHDFKEKFDALFDSFSVNQDKHAEYEDSLDALNSKVFNHDIRISVLEDNSKLSKLVKA